jgi:deoxycytidine triphosphate deaminase
MKTLFVLVGIQGSGKSTALEFLKNKGFKILKPSTTRTQRSATDDEYYFETTQGWGTQSYAWEIQRSNAKYGMRLSEIEASDSCITVFDPGNLQTLYQSSDRFNHEIITIGLNTISSIGVQNQRVNNDSSRKITDINVFDRELEAVCSCDIVISGDQAVIESALVQITQLGNSRGGILNEDIIKSLIKANTLLLNTIPNKVQAASYDLHLANTYWCEGNFHEIDKLDNHTLTIPPYSYVIVQAQEEAHLPKFISGNFDLKVSMFFNGLILSNGPQVDPGYRGALFCMLYNASDIAFTLKKGSSFATIQFFSTSSTSDGYRGKYQDKVEFIDFIQRKGLNSSKESILSRINAVSNENKAFRSKYGKIFWGTLFFLVALVIGTEYNLYSTAQTSISKAEESFKDIEKKIAKATSDLDKLQKTLDKQNAQTK